MNKSLKLLLLFTFAAVALAACQITVTDTTPEAGYVIFINGNEEPVTTGTLKYSMRNINAFGSYWPEEVTYGNLSSTKSVAPFSGVENITGQIKDGLSTEWVDVYWTVNERIVSGDTTRIVLKWID